MNRFLLLTCAAVAAIGCQIQNAQISSDTYAIQRRNMIRWDLRAQGIQSERILNAMMEVPRHLFLPTKVQTKAYLDSDLPIGAFVTTPRPFIVARTIELLNLQGTEKVLEVGTGRGYQSALLGDLAKEVYTIEILPDLAAQAEKTLNELHYKNVFCKAGDGFQGWAEHAPFDKILVMASAESVPQPLLDQLAPNGHLVMPVGSANQQSLVVYKKEGNQLKQESIMPVALKPLEGQAARKYW